MVKALEELRKELHIMLDSQEKSYEEILKVSQELDNKIVLYYTMNYLNDWNSKEVEIQIHLDYYQNLRYALFQINK